MRSARKLVDEKKNGKVLKLKELLEEFKKLYDIWTRAHDKKKRNQESDTIKDK